MSALKSSQAAVRSLRKMESTEVEQSKTREFPQKITLLLPSYLLSLMSLLRSILAECRCFPLAFVLAQNLSPAAWHAAVSGRVGCLVEISLPLLVAVCWKLCEMFEHPA